MRRMPHSGMAILLLNNCPGVSDADVMQALHEAGGFTPVAPGHFVLALNFGAGGVKIHTASDRVAALKMWKLAQDCLSDAWLECLLVVSAEQWNRCLDML